MHLKVFQSWIGFFELELKCKNCFQIRKQNLYILEKLIPNAPENAKKEVNNEYQCYIDDNKQSVYIMLTSISPKL